MNLNRSSIIRDRHERRVEGQLGHRYQLPGGRAALIQKEYSQISIREKEWQYEKEMLTQRISGLEAELRSNAIVCENLVNRIKILEVALKEEK
jgi:hypothetical protein